MNTTKAPAKKVTFSMDPELHEAAKKHAQSTPDRNFSRYISRLIQEDFAQPQMNKEFIDKVTEEVAKKLADQVNPKRRRKAS